MNKKKILGVVLLIAGVLLISIPYLTIRSLNSNSQQGVDYFNKLNAEDILKNNREVVEDENFNFESVEEISPMRVLLDPSKINPKLIVGQITIESIDLDLTLFKGVSETNLLAGAGTMKPSQIMGEGNYAVAGHNSRKGALFYKLDQAKINDIIKITDKENIYEYEIYDRKIVPPTALYMIENTEADKRGGPIISLMNCYYENGKNTGNRYFVLGDLVNIYEYDESKM